MRICGLYLMNLIQVARYRNTVTLCLHLGFVEFYYQCLISPGIQNMSKEEWIIFRSKSYRFEEFLNIWDARLKSSPEKTSLTVRLLQDVEKYKV